MQVRQSVFAEQPHSLVRRLLEAGLHRGDEANVELIGVGVHEPIRLGAASLAFCPLTTVLILPDTYQGGAWSASSDELEKSAVWFDRPSCDLIKAMRGCNGFVRLQAELLWTPRYVHLNKLQLVTYAPYEGLVNRPESFEESGLTLVT